MRPVQENTCVASHLILGTGAQKHVSVMPFSALGSPACTDGSWKLTVMSSSLDNATNRGHETAQKSSDMSCKCGYHIKVV